MAPPPFKIPFPRVQDEVSAEIYKKIKEKNVSKRSLTVMAPFPFKLPFPRRSRTKTSQNLQKRKEKNVSERSLNCNRHPGTSPFKLPFPRGPGRSFQVEIYKK